jgi:hypothetical protein
LNWSEQKVLVKVSREGIYPLEYHSSLKYMLDLGDRLTSVFEGLFTKSFSFKLERVSTYLLDGSINVKVAEQIKTDLSAKYTKERKLMSERSWPGEPSAPFVATALENPVLDELGIVNGVESVVNVFKTSSEWESKEFYDSKSLDFKVSKDMNLAVGRDGVAASASGAQVVSETFEWELRVNFYASTELMLDKQLIKKGLAKSEWALVNNRFTIISKLYEKREAECKRFSWGNFMGKARPFTSPFQLVLAGRRFSCKTSIVWAIEIAEGGWESPTFRVRPPINGEAEQLGSTTLPNEFELQQSRNDLLFCKIFDLPGGKTLGDISKATTTMGLEPHQFVVLVVAANDLFSKDGTLVNNFEKVFQDLPYSEDATMILLTKWDLLLYDETPPTDAADLACRLDDMWQDQAMLNSMEQCCARLRDALGGEKGPSVRYQRTPISTKDSPSLQTVQAIQKMSVDMLEDFLACVCKKLELTMGVNHIYL